MVLRRVRSSRAARRSLPRALTVTADAGDLGVDFEAGFAADGDAGRVGGAVGDGGGVGFLWAGGHTPHSVTGGAGRGVCRSPDRNLWGLLRWGRYGSESTRVVACGPVFAPLSTRVEIVVPPRSTRHAA